MSASPIDISRATAEHAAEGSSDPIAARRAVRGGAKVAGVPSVAARVERARTTQLGWGVKLAYGLGDLTVGLRQTAVVLFLLPFYTDVVLLAPALAGLALAVGRAWDACNDPIIGYLSDQTRTRFGRRRPYLIAAAIPLGIAFAALWRPPVGLGQAALCGYLIATFCVLDVFFGLYATPYLALGAEMSDDYHERTQIAVTRAVFHNVGIFLGGGVLPVIVAHAGNAREGYRAAGEIFAGLMTIAALVAFFGSREQPRAMPRQRIGLRRFLSGIRSTLENRAFRVVLGSFALLLFGASLNQSFAVFVFRDSFAMGDHMPLVMTLYLGATTASLPLWSIAARRLGKNRAFEACLAWSIVTLSMSVLLPSQISVGALLAFLLFAGLGNGGYVLPVAIAADVIDDDELRLGERREGAFFGMWTWVMKLAAACGVGVAGLILPSLGYVAGQTQSAATVFALKLVWGPVAALFFVAALVVFRRFPITLERHREIQRALLARRAAARDA